MSVPDAAAGAAGAAGATPAGATPAGATPDGAAPDWSARLRVAGLRNTGQRRAVLAALHELGHATVEQLAARISDRAPEVSLSTLYRTLEALDAAGLVSHAHLHHGTPTWHSVDGDPHVHLVCTRCGTVTQQPASVANELARTAKAATGFTLDVAHLALHGTCARCQAIPQGTAGRPGPRGALGQS